MAGSALIFIFIFVFHSFSHTVITFVECVGILLELPQGSCCTSYTYSYPPPPTHTPSSIFCLFSIYVLPPWFFLYLSSVPVFYTRTLETSSIHIMLFISHAINTVQLSLLFVSWIFVISPTLFNFLFVLMHLCFVAVYFWHLLHSLIFLLFVL